MNDKLKNAVEKLCEDLTNAMHKDGNIVVRKQHMTIQ